MTAIETYGHLAVKGGKWHRAAEPSRPRLAWFREPTTTQCGATVTALNVSKDRPTNRRAMCAKCYGGSQ